MAGAWNLLLHNSLLLLCREQELITTARTLAKAKAHIPKLKHWVSRPKGSIMIRKSDLKNCRIFKELSLDQLDRLIPEIQLISLKSGDVLYQEGKLAQHVYIVKSGKMLLEQDVSTTVKVTVASIDKGESFGWAVLLDAGYHAVSAICDEDADIFMIDKDVLTGILEKDHTIGYRIMMAVSRVIKGRLNQRTEQFLRSMKTHPDVHELIEEQGS